MPTFTKPTRKNDGKRVAYTNARLIDPESGLDQVGALLTEGNKIIDLFNGEIDVNKKITIPTSSLSSGMYIVQIQSNGKIIQKKLTKM